MVVLSFWTERNTDAYCFNYNSTEVTWDEAKLGCSEGNGSLAMIRNEDERHIVQQFMYVKRKIRTHTNLTTKPMTDKATASLFDITLTEMLCTSAFETHCKILKTGLTKCLFFPPPKPIINIDMYIQIPAVLYKGICTNNQLTTKMAFWFSSARTWIGLTDTEHEGVYKFIDGTFPEWSMWRGGEPNGRRNENCAHLFGGSEDGALNDLRCDNILAYICERLLGKANRKITGRWPIQHVHVWSDQFYPLIICLSMISFSSWPVQSQSTNYQRRHSQCLQNRGLNKPDVHMCIGKGLPLWTSWPFTPLWL